MKQTHFLPSLRLRTCAVMFVASIALSPSYVYAQTTSTPQQIAQSVEQLSEAELAQTLAPIALYPDSLLTHILIASTYPLELVQANRWVKKQANVDVETRMQLAEQQSWDPSVIALTAFPTVLEKLNDDLDWTQNLGDAFLQDEESVLAMVQTLRRQADEANSFDDMDNMKVTKVEKQIIIEPAKPEVIYVPYYDTRVVYGNWYWRAYPPVYWYTRPVYAYHRPIYWGPSVYINFNYFFGSVHWSHRRVVVINHHHSHYYKPSRKIAYSSGAKRWKHQPSHRHGVAYRSSAVSKRYDSPQRYQHHQQAKSVRRDLHQQPRLNNSQAIHKMDKSAQHRVSQSLQNGAKPRQYDGNKSLNKDNRFNQPSRDKMANNDRIKAFSSHKLDRQDRVKDQLKDHKSPAQNKNYDRTTQLQKNQVMTPRQQPKGAVERSRQSTSNIAKTQPSLNKPTYGQPSHQAKVSPRQDSYRQVNNTRQSAVRTPPTRSSNHQSNVTKSRGIER